MKCCAAVQQRMKQYTRNDIERCPGDILREKRVILNDPTFVGEKKNEPKLKMLQHILIYV